MSEHASIPWITGGCSGRMIRPRDGYVGDGFLADVDTKANAEFIVRACNAHDALVAALQDAIECIRVFHGDAGWDIYEKSAPEMQRFYAALALANTPAEVKP